MPAGSERSGARKYPSLVVHYLHKIHRRVEAGLRRGRGCRLQKIVGARPSATWSADTVHVEYWGSEIEWTPWSGVIRWISSFGPPQPPLTTTIVPSSSVAAGSEYKDDEEHLAEAASN